MTDVTNYKPDFDVLDRVVDKMNKLFDPANIWGSCDSLHDAAFTYSFFRDKDYESWTVYFLNNECLSERLDIGDNQSEAKYIYLTEENEQKIEMLLTAFAVKKAEVITAMLANSNCSDKNKSKWAAIMNIEN